jgi:hypothetical protein
MGFQAFIKPYLKEKRNPMEKSRNSIKKRFEIKLRKKRINIK